MEYLGPKENPFVFRRFEASLHSEKDLENLKNRLRPLLGEEASEQCAFVLRSLADENFQNDCEQATQEFGRRLTHRFGDEESFFDLAPRAKFSDARSYKFLSNSGKILDHHSVGLLEFNPPKGRPFSLAFDLTYGDVFGSLKKDPISVFCTPGTRERTLEVLKNHYGGSWKVEYEFDPRTGNFVSRREK
jgi:hypothetical protein